MRCARSSFRKKFFFFLFAMRNLELARTRTSESFSHRKVFICKSLKDATQQIGIVASKVPYRFFDLTNDLFQLVRGLQPRLSQQLTGIATIEPVLEDTFVNGSVAKPQPRSEVADRGIAHRLS